jgi:hypothetical protein
MKIRNFLKIKKTAIKNYVKRTGLFTTPIFYSIKKNNDSKWNTTYRPFI